MSPSAGLLWMHPTHNDVHQGVRSPALRHRGKDTLIFYRDHPSHPNVQMVLLYVALGDDTFDQVELSCGVPQGSICGPLFLGSYVRSCIRTCLHACVRSITSSSCSFPSCNAQHVFLTYSISSESMTEWHEKVNSHQ